MPLTLKASSVTITGSANIDVTDNQLTISSNESGVITWNPIIPGANNRLDRNRTLLNYGINILIRFTIRTRSNR